MQQLPPSRIAAIHDLSCVGRCALTVIIPVLSVMGYQTIPVPTAFLSTHTGGFTDLHFRDLTDDMHAVIEHFSKLEMNFGAIYTGFLGSELQIRTVKEFIERFGCVRDESGKMPLILIDPVMGDDGVLYSTYTPELVAGMRELSAHAHVLTPNLTEACLLTDAPYRDTERMPAEEAEAFVRSLLKKLERFGCERIVITGVSLCNGIVLNLGKDADGTIFSVARKQIGVSYPGTGDIFASVLLGMLLAGNTFENACQSAADFVGTLIEASAKIDTPTRMGVALEPHLAKLI